MSVLNSHKKETLSSCYNQHFVILHRQRIVEIVGYNTKIKLRKH